MHYASRFEQVNLIILAAETESATGDGTDSDAVARVNRMLRLLCMSKLFKLARLSKLKKYLEYLVLLVKFNPALLRIMRLAIISLLCCHWFGCTWWLVSDLELTRTPSLAISARSMRTKAVDNSSLY